MTLYWNSASVIAVKGATNMDVLKACLQIESAALGVVQIAWFQELFKGKSPLKERYLMWQLRFIY